MCSGSSALIKLTPGSHVTWAPVTKAWCVIQLQMDRMASRHGR